MKRSGREASWPARSVPVRAYRVADILPAIRERDALDTDNA